jgi:nitrate reductase alpha subunit
VPTFAELNQLSSRELHDRAIARAKRHLDARFFWNLLQITPAAQVTAGEPTAAEEDVEHWSMQVVDAVKAEPEDAVDGRRAFYLDYLMRHAG